MTTRTLWLHVGIPKTSTTSYQSWMRAQAGALEHAGLLYPDHFGAGNDKPVSYTHLTLPTIYSV